MMNKKANKIIAIILAVLIGFSTIFCVIGTIRAYAAGPAAIESNTEIITEANDSNAEAIPEEVTTAQTTVTESEQTTTIQEETTESQTTETVSEINSQPTIANTETTALDNDLVSIEIIGLEKYDEVESITLKFTNKKTNEKTKLQFDKESTFYVAQALPAGDYKVEIKDISGADEAKLTNKNITIPEKKSEDDVVDINIKSVNVNEGFFEYFVKNNSILMVLLLVMIGVYVYIKKQNENKMRNEN